MKFALSQIKLALVKSLIEFEIESTDETPKFLKFNEGILRTTKDDIPIRFNPRL